MTSMATEVKSPFVLERTIEDRFDLDEYDGKHRIYVINVVEEHHVDYIFKFDIGVSEETF